MNRIVRAAPCPAPDIRAALTSVPTQAFAASHALGGDGVIHSALGGDGVIHSAAPPRRGSARVAGLARPVRRDAVAWSAELTRARPGALVDREALAFVRAVERLGFAEG